MKRTIHLFSTISIIITILAAGATYFYSVPKSQAPMFTNISIDTSEKIPKINNLFGSKSFHVFDDKGIQNVKTFSIDETKFWMKVVFSFVFLGAALYVILSKKYDDETKKWAFSVLTLIAGIWLGTATS